MGNKYSRGHSDIGPKQINSSKDPSCSFCPLRKRFHSTDTIQNLMINENFFLEAGLIRPLVQNSSESLSVTNSMNLISKTCENKGLDIQALKLVEKLAESPELRISIMVDLRTNMQLLVKEYTLPENIEFSRCSLQEEVVLSQLSHKNIIRVIGFQNVGNKFIIAFEYINKTLRDEITDRRAQKDVATLEEMEVLAKELICALFYLQFRGVFHGNICPENIFIQEEDTVKIGNFNQAQLIIGSLSSGTVLDSNFKKSVSTEEGSRASYESVTEYCASPEKKGKRGQVTNKKAFYWPPEFRKAIEGQKSYYDTFKVDTFSAGVCLLEVATQMDIEDIYDRLSNEFCESGKEEMFGLVRSRYGTGLEKLMRDMTLIDEEERKTTLILCFTPEKEYETILDLGHVAEFYNLKRVSNRESYNKIRRLGEGGFGEVFEVVLEPSGDRFAQKVIKDVDFRCLNQKLEEVLINSKMDHQNIVKFLYYDIESLPHRNDFYNVYSFIELMEISLEDEIKERASGSQPFSRAEVDGFLNCMSNAMRYMQEVKNTAHLDIKPQNILKKSGQYKICDFGVSLSNLPVNKSIKEYSPKGSPLYLAPELREQEKRPSGSTFRYHPFKSDIFSLGLTLLYMLTLTPPARDFLKEKEDRELFFLNEGVVKRIAELYDKELLLIIESMLRVDPKLRADPIQFSKMVSERRKLQEDRVLTGKIQALRQSFSFSERNGDLLTVFDIGSQIIELYQLTNDKRGLGNILHTLGNKYLEAGDVENAEESYKKSLSIFSEVCGFDHPQNAVLLENLGIIKIDQGNYREGIEYFRQSCNISIKFYGETHVKLLDTLINLGSAFDKVKEYNQALENYKRALDVYRENYQEERPRSVKVPVIYTNIGCVYRKLGNYKTALGYYSKAFSLLKTYFLTHFKQIAYLLQNVGLTYKKLGHLEEARSYLEKSLKTYINHHKNDSHFDVLSVMDNLASVYRLLGQKLKAKNLYEECLKKLEAHKDFKNERVFDLHLAVMNNLALVNKSLGETEPAIRLWKELHEILSRQNSRSHLLRLVLSNLGSVYLGLWKEDQNIEHLLTSKMFYEESLHLAEGEDEEVSKGVRNNIVLVEYAIAKLFREKEKMAETFQDSDTL